MFKLPKILLPRNITNIQAVLGRIESLAAELKAFVEGVKDGVGPDDVARAASLAMTIQYLVSWLKPIFK